MSRLVVAKKSGVSQVAASAAERCNQKQHLWLGFIPSHIIFMPVLKQRALASANKAAD